MKIQKEPVYCTYCAELACYQDKETKIVICGADNHPDFKAEDLIPLNTQ